MAKPTIMSPDMVLATLEYRKGETRRLAGLEKINEDPSRWDYLGRTLNGAIFDINGNELKNHRSFLSREGQYLVSYAPRLAEGDVVYVKENYRLLDAYDSYSPLEAIKQAGIRQLLPAMVYEATQTAIAGYGKLRPSIHMPEALARIWLRITHVRAERLQDITDQGCLAEGIQTFIDTAERMGYAASHNARLFDTPRQAFAHLIDSVNKPGTWDFNPWVWVYQFEVLSTTGKPEGLEVAND